MSELDCASGDGGVAGALNDETEFLRPSEGGRGTELDRCKTDGSVKGGSGDGSVEVSPLTGRIYAVLIETTGKLSTSDVVTLVASSLYNDA